MYPPRFAHPNNYMPNQPQWRAHGSGFARKWPMQHVNNTTNYYSKGPSNFYNSNEEHWCETCDRGFRTLQLLEQHKQQHQKCNIDGCQFVAHPKVITKHIQMQHSTGLFKKIAISDNPEEIRKWREERKKRYPTKENIEKKGAEIKEKIARGEKMCMKYNREKQPHKPEQGIKRKYFNENNHKQNFQRRSQTGNSHNEVTKTKITVNVHKKTREVKNHRESKLIPSMDDLRSIKPFTGILHLLDIVDKDNITEEISSNYIIDDVDEYNIVDACNEINVSTTVEPVVCEALTSLMCSYISSDDESVNDMRVTHSQPTTENKQKNLANFQSSKINVSNSAEHVDEDSGPEEVKIIKVTDVENNTHLPNTNDKEENQTKPDIKMKKIEKRPKIYNNRRNSTMKHKSKLPSTLLEKLLHNEIRQERNIVLQCIRHIVRNDYFDNNLS